MQPENTSSRRSAIDPLLQMLRIAGALYRDLGNRALDVAEIVGGEFDASRSDVLVEAVQLRGAGDRNDPRLLGKQPGDRDLGTRHPLLGRDLAEHLDQGLVRLPGLRREARNDVAEVGTVERRVLVDRARQEALAERAEGDEADTELLESRQDLLLGLSPPQRIFALEGSDRLHRVCAPDRLHACFGKAEVLDLAFLDQLLYRAGNVFDRHVRIDAVLIEEIDAVGLQALERGLGDLPDVLWPAVKARLCVSGFEAELGSDHHPITEWGEGCAHELLVGERAVSFRRVE